VLSMAGRAGRRHYYIAESAATYWAFLALALDYAAAVAGADDLPWVGEVEPLLEVWTPG
jgi:hypothetical protein